MSEYVFRALNIRKTEVIAIPPFAMSTHLQYVANESRLNCVGLEPAYFSEESPTVPKNVTTQLNSKRVSILVGWAVDKLENILSTKNEYRGPDGAGGIKVQNLSVYDVTEDPEIRKFKFLASNVDYEGEIDIGSKKLAITVEGIPRPVPVSAVLGAYSLYKIDEGLCNAVNGNNSVLTCLMESACALVEATRHRMGDHFLSEQKLISSATGKQKTGSVTAKLCRYNTTAWDIWDKKTPASNNSAYEVVKDDLEKLSYQIVGENSQDDQHNPPAKGTVMNWYKKGMRA